jgi:galactofuranose transport system substrate-binding protein
MTKNTNFIKLVIAIALCGSMALGNKEKLIVGFSQMENNNPWRIAETNSIIKEAQKRNIELIYTDAKSQTAKQVSDVKDLIARKVKYVILAPREYLGLAPALREANKAHIPVILVDRDASGIPGVDYVTLIASDFIMEGELAAEWLVKKTDGKANIVEITGTAGSSVARDRSEGFRRVIRKYPEMMVIASQTGEFIRVNGQKVMENIIQEKGKKISAVFAHNDEMAIGAIQALKAAGITPGQDVILVSVDGEKDALKAIVAGELGASVECNPRFGPKVFDVIEKHLKGEKIPITIINRDRFFDSSNARDFIEEAY